jgi:hypothetical protein
LITLDKGHELAGKVVEHATGYPIPGATVMGVPEVVAGANTDGLGFAFVETTTDENGRFLFTTLAKRKYQLIVQGARFGGANGAVSVEGGQHESVTLRVSPDPGSALKTRPPRG